MQQWCQKIGLIGLTTLIMTGCNHLTAVKRATEADWRAGTPTETQAFDSSGRLAVVDEGKGSYANFNWQSLSQVQTIEVNTPLGNSVGVLCRDQFGVIAEDNHGQITTAASVEELSQNLLGFALPFDHLNQWVQGYWITNQPHKILPDGSLQQSGWIIHRDLLKENHYPRIVKLNNQRFEIKLVFDQFSPTAENTPQCELRQKQS